MASILDEVLREIEAESTSAPARTPKGVPPSRRKKKPESVLAGVEEEEAETTAPSSVLAEIEREEDVDPASVRRRRAEGEKLTTEQQRIAFEAERARPLTDVALGAAGAFVKAVPQTVGQLARGAGKLGYETATGLGEAALSGLIYEPGSAEQEAAVRRGLGRPASALRSVASGVAQDIEETVNAGTRAALFGTSITDRMAEAAGLIDNEKSFQNYLSREDMRAAEARDIQENPDRASTLLARNPLAGTVIQAASIATGQGPLSPEAEKAAIDEYRKIMTEEAQSFTPDEDLSMLGEVVSPVGLPARLVGPVTRATGGTMETLGGGLIRVATKPTVKGVNPLEGVGIGIRKIGEGAEAVGAKVSEAITGRPDTFLASPATLVSAFTKRPGELIEGTGRTFRDIGRQIDAGGIRGRTGLIERLGRDPQSADWVRDLFGTGSQARLDRIAKRNAERIELGKPEIKVGKGGILRARAADYSLRTANALSKAGVSGAALNGIIGAADIETAEEFGRAAGVGFGIGATMQANVPGKIETILDPTKSVAQRIDKFLEVDPLDRRLDEDADLKRFRATADPEILKKVETLASPEEQINAVQRDINELIQLKTQAENEGKDTAQIDAQIAYAQRNLTSLQSSTPRMTQEDRDTRRRQTELIMADALDLLKTTGRAAGLNGIDVRILGNDEFEAFLRDKWGKNLQDAEAIVAQLDGLTDLSESEEATLNRARQTVAQFRDQLVDFPKARGFALSQSNQAKLEPHLQMSNIGAPTAVISVETLLRRGPNAGLRHVLQHEGMHVLEEFREVQDMQRPIRELWFGKTVTQPDGTTIEVQPGVFTNDWLDTEGVRLYGRLMPGGEAEFRRQFDSVEELREYIRKELLGELSGVSESGYATIREALDSPGQAIVDRFIVASKNSLLGRTRAALEAMGVELDGQGNVESVIFGDAAPFNPDALALMRQLKRQLRDFNDTLTYAGGDAAPDVTISLTELMTNRALQEAFKDDVIWDKETVVNVYDDAGNFVAEIPITPNKDTDRAVGEYRFRNGRFVDQNGIEFDLTPGVSVSGLPDNSRAFVESRIARNPDGSPKILTNKEIKARARLRDQMIKDAIDKAPDDGFKGRLRDTGNGSYRGTLSPSQLEAIFALPNDVVPPSIKRNVAAFNEILQRKDGTRILMEYQPALRGGKYRALAPKIRDVVPIGFQFSKQGNFLATTISVSRMFDKMNAWAQKKPERLNLWGRDLGRFWEDVSRVLDNHNKDLPGQTNLDIDPEIAMQKKNIINDFFNLFNKDTEAANPDRTKLPVRRGQDSPDRIIMSARMDRINQMQVSNADKLPVDYGKMTVNFFPAEDGRVMRLDQFQDPEVENNITGGPGAQFLPGIRYTSLPDDPKKTMADFYMLNAMITTPPTGWSMGKFDGKATMYAPSADPTGRYAGTRAEKYQDALDEAKQTLIPTLHGKITKALQFAVAAELRHIEDQVAGSSIPQDLIETPFFQEYMREYAIQKSGLPGLKKQRAPRRYKSDSESYRRSFVAMEAARQKTGTSLSDAALLAERMFREPQWSSSYGGPKWGDIAAHLAQMSDPAYSTERVRAVVTDPETGRMQIVETNEFRDPGAYSQMFQEIDRAYDLQHNTNTVFNKLKKYYLGSEGYGWIAKMLDFKANVGNPRELRGLVSGTMGRLADAWFADMRADAPLTQDLEESVKAQLPENFKDPALGPDQFIEVLKDLVSGYYRKSSGVRRENPFENIANAAEGIHRNLGRGSDAWKAIKKDQNAHIGLILQDHFGDLGIAQTDAIKLFRMLLVEGRDPRVTGKKERTPISVPLPTAGNAGIADPVKSGKGKTGPSAVISPGDLLSENQIKDSAAKIYKNYNKGAFTPGVAPFVNVDILGHRMYLAPNSNAIPDFVDLTVRKKNASGPAFGPPLIIDTISISGKTQQDIVASVTAAIQKFQDNLTIFIPADAPSDQYFIGGKTFVPNQKQSAPTNLNKFVETLLGSSSFNGLKLGNVTVLNAGGSGKAVKLDVFAGDSTSPANQLTSVTIPDGKKRDIVDWLSDYGMMQAKQSGYTSLMGWMAQDLSESVKPEMPKPSKKIQNIIDGLPGFAKLRVYQLLEDLQDIEWIDANLGNLPPSDLAASEKYVTDLVYGDATGLEKAKIADAMSANDVLVLGKYLYDVAKWASDKLEARQEAQMLEIDENAGAEETGLTLDSPAVGYAKSDDTLMTIAEAAAQVGPFNEGEIGGTNHVYFTDNSGTAITNPYEDSIGDPLVTGWAPGNKDAIMKYWADNGVLPSVSETALAIFDAANPGHPYSKPETKTESESLLTPDQDLVMQAASELVSALAGGYIAQPEVTIGNKNFSAKINEQGNMVVFAQDENGLLTGAYPIQGSKTMDPIDLEAAVYEALDLLGAGFGKIAETPKATKITPQMINEAADALMNDETASLGKYTFEPIASGLGGTRVNIYIEPGMDEPVSYFMLDPGEYRDPSDMLDAFHDGITEFLENNPEFDDGSGGTGPGAQMMPGEGITPKTLYNFYHLATLESQGRIKSEYGQSLMKEYLDVYRQRYLDTIGPLVADQIRKYIGRGRVDEPVTEEALEAAANDPEKLDELMRQTYRSDMKRHNDVWNNITEHLKGLEAARSARDIIFRIDRLNNAIHNTNELLFSKFSNAADLLDTFEAINAARDERAYARNVDRDLRQIEEFEGGPGARFMPDVANAEDLTSAVASILSARNVRDERAKKWLREAYRKNFVQLGLPEGLERASLSDYRAKKGDPDWMRKPGLQRFKSLKAAEKDRIGHIADYLNTLDERELSKLPKQTLADVEKKVAEWDKMLQKKMGESAKFTKEGKDIETLETFEDGFRIVRLLSKGAYNDEGKCMGHCVGSYDPTDKNRTILSLRGPDGESHATLELVKDFEKYAYEIIEDIQREGIDRDEMEMEGDFDEDIDYDYDTIAEAEQTFLDEHGFSSMEDVTDLSETVKNAKGGFIVQIKGKANEAPKKVYADKILRFIQNNSDRYVIAGEGENLGLQKRLNLGPDPQLSGESKNIEEPNTATFFASNGTIQRRMFFGESAYEDYLKMMRTPPFEKGTDPLLEFMFELEKFAQKKINEETIGTRYPKSWSKKDRDNFEKIENLDLESAENWPKIKDFLKKQFGMVEEKNRRAKTDIVRYLVALVKIPAGAYLAQKPFIEQREVEVKKFEENKQAAIPLAFKLYSEPTAGLGAQMMPAGGSDFYLKSAQVLDSKIQGKTATTDQVKAILTNPQNGIKAEELKWTGVLQAVDRLAKENNGKVPKEALLNNIPIWRVDITPEMRESITTFGQAQFMPGLTEVPTQKTLDELKKRLPKYAVEIADIPDYLTPDAIHISLKNARGEVIGRATVAAEHPDYPQAIEVMGTSVKPSYRGKGYGEALYREVAKYAQSQGKKFMFAHTVSEDAARVRRKLFKEEESRDGKWKKEGWPMLSRVGPGIRYMPGNAPDASQVDQSLAGVAAPDVDRGPLSGARFMPREVSGETAWRGSYLNEQRRHGAEFGGGNYEAWRKNPFLKAFEKLGTTQVTYLAKDQDLAYDFAQRAKEESYRGEPGLKKLRVEKYKIRGKSTKLFDPLDAEDREKVAKVLKKKRIPENFAKRALKKITAIDEYYGNWKSLEMLAPAIKEAGFDGYIAMETLEEETYGLFGDVAGIKDSMATPIRANSSGKNVQFMPGYNPRYTDDDGNFNFGLYSEDKRKTIAYLRDRMGITRKDFPNDEEWKRIIRETMRDVIRGD